MDARPIRTLGRALVCLGWLYVASAAAQADGAPDARVRAEASAHFQRGVTLYREGAHRAALVEFERANELAPDYRLLFNIGQTRLDLGDYLGASQAFEAYLAQGGAEVQAQRRDEVEQMLATLRERLGSLAISVNLPGAEVFVDDNLVGIAPLRQTVTVNVGRHRVVARTKRGTEQSRVIDVAGGDIAELRLTLDEPRERAQPARPVPTGPSRMRPVAVVGLAAGGTATLGAVITGTLAAQRQRALERELERELPDADRVDALRSAAKRLAFATDATALFALVATGGGLTLWLLDARRRGRELRLESNGVSSLSVRGTF